MKVLTPGRKPIFLWCDDIEDQAFEQLVNVSNHPKLFHHLAAMADTHTGFGMVIGGVAALDNAIAPNFVGKDAGCGVIARRLNLVAGDLPEATRQDLYDRIKELVPMGLGKTRKEPHIYGPAFLDSVKEELLYYKVIKEDQIDYLANSMGTLGSGNHFVEVQHDESFNIWLMIHTGSRKLGELVNTRFHERGAMKLCDMWESKIADPDIAFLPIGTPEASMYISAMSIAMAYAKFNREAILEGCMQAFKDVVGYDPEVKEKDGVPLEINTHHNYACTEKHYGKTVWVHRKGAIKVAKGEVGIIPGDMNSKSYIVTGKGSRESFDSCSHGAGRAMSRTAARAAISVEQAEEAMKGIVHGDWKGTDRKGRTIEDTSEAPGAYKDISEVMLAQTDLIEVSYELTPIINIKG